MKMQGSVTYAIFDSDRKSMYLDILYVLGFYLEWLYTFFPPNVLVFTWTNPQLFI